MCTFNINRGARRATAAATLLLCGWAPSTWAATQIGEHFTLSGFGTLGGVVTDTNEAKFGRDHQRGGADKTADFEVDSNLGLQLTGVATPWLSGTLQVLVAKRDKAHMEADADWAFVNVAPLEGLNLRVGRMTPPVFTISDSRNIGYANNWLRQPGEVYSLNMFRRLEGIDATYRKSFGSVALHTTVFYGSGKFKQYGSQGEGKKLRGLNLVLESDWATVRLGQAKANVDVPDLRAFGDGYTFSGAGITIDRDRIFVQSEYVRRESKQLPAVVNADGWYVMAGYRFGAILPYVIQSKVWNTGPAFPVKSPDQQKTTALGVRWDVLSNAALKFQFERIDTGGGNGISFSLPGAAVPPGFPDGMVSVSKPVNALSVALDFTF